MEEKQCSGCEYFLQHYGIKDGVLFSIHCGHCRFRRAKQKRPDDRACEHFVPGVEEREKFVTKEYLTKELLRYVLSMELFPEMK